MKIFADYHHSGLMYSLKLTLEDRLGHELYRPVGLDWFDQGFFDIAKPYDNDENTVKQYLAIDSTYYPVDGSPPLNKIEEELPDHYVVDELFHDYKQKAITLEQFKQMDIDVIIASIPDHYVTYKKLRDRYKPKAKVVCQAGNIVWNDLILNMARDGTITNFMGAVKPFEIKGVHSVFCHEEQPGTAYNAPEPIPAGYGQKGFVKKIKSFCHLLPHSEQFNIYKEQLSDFVFKAYGAGTPEGSVSQLSALYAEMKQSTYVYHVKPGGDGYGWNWHTAYLCGRPIITNFSDYQDKLGGLLFEDGVNGIDLERRSVKDNCDLIKRLSEPEEHQKMCLAARLKFEEVVNYEDEGKQIQTFLETLV